MVSVSRFISKVARFRRKTSGATAVEFAILLPVMLVTFGAIVEGSRIYWNYQAAVSGVRDASRYLARVTNNDVGCGGGAPPVEAALWAREIIDRNMDTDGSGNLGLPSGVTVSAVSVTPGCRNFDGLSVPIYTVDATVEIEIPLGALFSFFGATTGLMESTITDQSRIYGL